MTVLDIDRSIVVVIDMQGKLVDLVERPQLTMSSIQRLLQFADAFSVPVVLTEQYPAGLGPTCECLLAQVDALETAVFKLEKDSFSCCEEPAFLDALRRARPAVPLAEQQVVVAGIEAHVCVVQTVLGLIEHGCTPHVCWEAVSGRGAEYRRWALERMQAAGAIMTNHESAAFEWARDKNHPAFKSVNKILRGGQLS